jgi:hypothetical protein
MINLEEKIWDYIDGLASQQEREELEAFLSQNPLAQQQFEELSMLNVDFKDLELDEPSMSFSANIMREINAPLSKKASIDKRIIYAIGGFFGLAMLSCVIIVLGEINWSAGADFSLNIDDQIGSISQSLQFSTPFKSYLLYGFLMFDIAVALIFFDQYLRKKDVVAN